MLTNVRLTAPVKNMPCEAPPISRFNPTGSQDSCNMYANHATVYRRSDNGTSPTYLGLFCVISLFLIQETKAQPAIPASAESPASAAQVSPRIPTQQQNPDAAYEFKVAHLGMSLDDFKKATGGGTAHVTGPETHGIFAESYWARKNRDAESGPTPFCTDTLSEFPGAPPKLVEGEVICNPSPENAHPELLSVAGAHLSQCIYHFYQGRLYMIVIQASAGDFDSLVRAFSDKYGTPHADTPTRYENGYGAKWAGRNFYWQRGTQVIYFGEGRGNGPAQSAADLSTAIISDPALGPPTAPHRPLDF